MILAIDTSFDDTAAAIVDGIMIRSNVLSTELDVHLEYGGVVPRLARASHEQNIDRVIALALKRAHVDWDAIDAIAVTVGPGLAICLEVGIAVAKSYAKKYKKPLIPVNHMEGHLLSFLAKPYPKDPSLRMQCDRATIEHIYFPTLSVLLSGGHTQFVYAKTFGDYEIVGETQDDAMGEAFDKVGRMLGLGYPAAPLVEKMAKDGVSGRFVFPIPMRQIHDSNLSYSGLKTALLRTVEKQERLSRQDVADIASGFQYAAIKHMQEKLERALASSSGVKTLSAGGGVLKNLTVRKTLRKVAKQRGILFCVPPIGKLCADNAAMIGIAAQFSKLATVDYDSAIFDRKPTWRL